MSREVRSAVENYIAGTLIGGDEALGRVGLVTTATIQTVGPKGYDGFTLELVQPA